MGREAGQDTVESREARLVSNVKSGRVLNVSSKEAASMIIAGWALLDVRPVGEVSRAPLKGSINVPLFIEDNDNSLGGIGKKLAFKITGGWWLGGTHCVLNRSFVESVKAQIPLGSSLVVCCQKGLRSLAACEALVKEGYGTIAWLNGGLDASKRGDIPTTTGVDVRYGGVGGVSLFLGWTEVQQEEGKTKLGGSRGALIALGALIAIDVILFFLESGRSD